MNKEVSPASRFMRDAADQALAVEMEARYWSLVQGSLYEDFKERMIDEDAQPAKARYSPCALAFAAA